MNAFNIVILYKKYNCRLLKYINEKYCKEIPYESTCYINCKLRVTKQSK